MPPENAGYAYAAYVAAITVYAGYVIAIWWRGRSAGDENPCREAARSSVPSSGDRRATGTVYLVGAGPGDPGLLTVRARALLDDCDAIVYDALVSTAPSRALRPRHATPPESYFVGKRGGDEGSASQHEITALLVRLARAGKSVVRLKGGDPFVFGRGGEEAQALARASIPFEVVPGVMAGVAAPAYAGIPVTHWGVATGVTFVTGHEDPGQAGSRRPTGGRSRAAARRSCCTWACARLALTIGAEGGRVGGGDAGRGDPVGDVAGTTHGGGDPRDAGWMVAEAGLRRR